jgi:hypothetical protein
MSDSVKISLAKFGEAIEKNFDISGKINAISDGLAKMVQRFSELKPEMQKFIFTWGGIIIAIGPVLLALGTLIKLFPIIALGFSRISKAIAGVRIAIVALTTPIVGMPALFLGIVGAIGLVIAALGNWESRTSKMTQRLNEQREAARLLREEKEKSESPFTKKYAEMDFVDSGKKGKSYADFQKEGFKETKGKFTFAGDFNNAVEDKKVVPRFEDKEATEKAQAAAKEAERIEKERWAAFIASKERQMADIKELNKRTIEEQSKHIEALNSEESKKLNEKLAADSKYKSQLDKNGLDLNLSLQFQLDSWRRHLQSLRDLTLQINDILVQGVQDALINLATVLGQNIVDKDPFNDLGLVLLDSLGKLMVQLGGAMITFSTIFVAFKKAIQAMQPEIAIPLGIAMVAAGAAVSKIAANALNPSGGASAASGSASSSGASGGSLILTTRLDGRDLVMSGTETSRVRRR